MTQTVGILGIGLIGGSIGLRMRRDGVHVVGADRESSALQAAFARGAIDVNANVDELYDLADIVVIAAHLDGTLRELERLAREPKTRRTTLVLDVSSVKLPVRRAASRLNNFVGTHPLAGSERCGVAAARADLFEGAAWAYVPTGNESLDGRACDFIRSCGANPIAIAADAHDRMVALTSHVPAIIATRYTDLLRGEGDALQLTGPVARELLRIGDMNPTMWEPILHANAHSIAPHLRRLAAELGAAADALSGNGSARYAEVVPKR